MAKRDHRFVILLSKEELDDVQEYRWGQRVPSLGDAGRELIKAGLAAKNEKADAEPASA